MTDRLNADKEKVYVRLDYFLVVIVSIILAIWIKNTWLIVAGIVLYICFDMAMSAYGRRQENERKKEYEKNHTKTIIEN